MKMPGKCTGTKYLSKILEKKKRGKRHLGGHDPVRRMDRQGEVLIRFRKCSGVCEAKNGSETDELLQAGADGHQRVWQNVEDDSSP